MKKFILALAVLIVISYFPGAVLATGNGSINTELQKPKHPPQPKTPKKPPKPKEPKKAKEPKKPKPAPKPKAPPKPPGFK
jgi:outer membrane biosynthesis protein TonB